MIEIKAETKKWGNSSLAFVIPKDVVEKKHLRSNQQVRVLLLEDSTVLKKTFGRLRHLRGSTRKMLREADEALWHD